MVLEVRTELVKAHFAPTPREALLLVSRVLGVSEAELLAHDERHVGNDERRQVKELLARRLQAEPIAYLLQEKEFWGRPFLVDGRVLIPRPETEHLVEAVLGLDLSATTRILELGTGSGCVAISLALERPDTSVMATDISLAALAVARQNARRHSIELSLVQGDVLTAIRDGSFDLLVWNPPYIADGERQHLSAEILDYEPSTALFAGADGLGAIERLFRQLARLRAGVPIVLEIGAAQSKPVSELASLYDLTVKRKVEDYAGNDRVVVLERCGSTKRGRDG